MMEIQDAVCQKNCCNFGLFATCLIWKEKIVRVNKVCVSHAGVSWNHDDYTLSQVRSNS